MKASKVGITLLITAALAGTAFAGAWAIPSGEIPGVLSYSNGGDINGLFGEPDITAWTPGAGTFFFTPDGFNATASSGETAVVTDTVSVDIEFFGAYSAALISVAEIGGYSVTGASMVDVETTLVITEIGGFNRVKTVHFTETYDTQTWQAMGTLDLSIEPMYQNFTLSLTNTLTATAEEGQTASIWKTGAATSVEIAYVPEPATLGLLSLLGLVIRRR